MDDLPEALQDEIDEALRWELSGRPATSDVALRASHTIRAILERHNLRPTHLRTRFEGFELVIALRLPRVPRISSVRLRWR